MPAIIPAIFTDDGDAFLWMLRASETFAPEVHIDVTDGLFVEQRSVSIANVMAAKPKIPVEFHLMVKEPLAAVDQLRRIPGQTIIVHLETLGDAKAARRLLRRRERVIGLALNPHTPISSLCPWLADLTRALVMGVAPGERGASPHIGTPDRIRELRTMWPNGTISTDGGMNAKTIPAVAQVGADRIIVATAIWQSPDPRSEYLALQEIASRSTDGGLGC